MDEIRNVHLRGATGQIRTATYDKRNYMVVPVVALMEGVIHAINAATPEFVPLSSLSVAPQGWNGRPVVVRHPARNGRQVSANDPTVLEAQGVGSVFNARVEDTKLLCEAWIDPVKAELIGQGKMLDRLRAGEMIEVSVGAFVVTKNETGEHNGKPYKAVWAQVAPDHLAMLPDGIGACSIAMGCGTRAATAHLVTAEGFEVVELEEKDEQPSILDRINTLTQSIIGKTTDDEEVKAAIGARNNKSDASMIQTMHDHAVSLGAECKEVKAAEATLETLDKDALGHGSYPHHEGPGGHFSVEPKTGGKFVVTHDGKPIHKGKLSQAQADALAKVSSERGLPPGGKYGETKKEWKAKQPGQMTKEQMQANYEKMHGRHAEDADVEDELLDEIEIIDVVSPEVKAACSCQEKKEGQMTKEQKAELIKTLVEHKHSGFTPGDEAILEAAPEDRLNAFHVAAVAREKEVTAAAEKTVVVEVKAAEEAKPLNEEDFMRLAPPALKALIDRTLAADTAKKADLVAALKTAQSEWTESELAAMSLDGLERFARALKVHDEAEKPDFSGRGIPRAAAKSENDTFLNPPDPYAAPLEAMRKNTVQ